MSKKQLELFNEKETHPECLGHIDWGLDICLECHWCLPCLVEASMIKRREEKERKEKK